MRKAPPPHDRKNCCCIGRDHHRRDLQDRISRPDHTHVAIESACIPLPSEIIMPFAGALAVPAVASYHNTSLLSLYLVAIAGAIGCNVGSVIAYEIGCYGGPRW